jgi:hypothetical protein
VNHDRGMAGDSDDDDEPLHLYPLELKHTGRVPFSKEESKLFTVSEGDHLATHFNDRDIGNGKGPKSHGWAWGRVRKTTAEGRSREVSVLYHLDKLMGSWNLPTRFYGRHWVMLKREMAPKPASLRISPAPGPTASAVDGESEAASTSMDQAADGGGAAAGPGCRWLD